MQQFKVQAETALNLILAIEAGIAEQNTKLNTAVNGLAFIYASAIKADDTETIAFVKQAISKGGTHHNHRKIATAVQAVIDSKQEFTAETVFYTAYDAILKQRKTDTANAQAKAAADTAAAKVQADAAAAAMACFDVDKVQAMTAKNGWTENQAQKVTSNPAALLQAMTAFLAPPAPVRDYEAEAKAIVAKVLEQGDYALLVAVSHAAQETLKAKGASLKIAS